MQPLTTQPDCRSYSSTPRFRLQKLTPNSIGAIVNHATPCCHSIYQHYITGISFQPLPETSTRSCLCIIFTATPVTVTLVSVLRSCQVPLPAYLPLTLPLPTIYIITMQHPRDTDCRHVAGQPLHPGRRATAVSDPGLTL